MPQDEDRFERPGMWYEFDGEKYEKASSHQKEWGSRLIQELDLRGDERILDLGCGDGALTAQLALRAPRGIVVGIDASAGMIAAAERHAAGNLRFVQKDINAKPRSIPCTAWRGGPAVVPRPRG